MITFWKKNHYKFIKSSIWTSVLEIWSWTFDGGERYFMTIMWRTSDPKFHCKLTPSEQVQREEPKDIEDKIEKSSTHRKCVVTSFTISQVGVVRGEKITLRWSERLQTMKRDWGLRKEGLQDRKKRSILRSSQLRKDDFYKYGFTEGCRRCNAIITRENTAVAGAKWMENVKEVGSGGKCCRKEQEEWWEPEEKEGSESGEMRDRKEDDVTKDASEQFAKGVTRASRRGVLEERQDGTQSSIPISNLETQ